MELERLNETVMEQRDNITNSTREVTLLLFHYILIRNGQLKALNIFPHKSHIIYRGLIHMTSVTTYIMYVTSSESQ